MATARPRTAYLDYQGVISGGRRGRAIGGWHFHRNRGLEQGFTLELNVLETGRAFRRPHRTVADRVEAGQAQLEHIRRLRPS
ncbi:MAG: hypothetical protein R3B96_08170 [Pirellulaceae bacterium]